MVAQKYSRIDTIKDRYNSETKQRISFEKEKANDSSAYNDFVRSLYIMVITTGMTLRKPEL